MSLQVNHGARDKIQDKIAEKQIRKSRMNDIFWLWREENDE